MYSPVDTTWTYCSRHTVLGRRFSPDSSTHPAATTTAAHQLDKGKLLSFMVLLHRGTATSLSHSCMCLGTVTQCWGQNESLGGTAGPDPLPTAQAEASTACRAARSHEAEVLAQLSMALSACGFGEVSCWELGLTYTDGTCRGTGA